MMMIIGGIGPIVSPFLGSLLLTQPYRSPVMAWRLGQSCYYPPPPKKEVLTIGFKDPGLDGRSK